MHAGCDGVHAATPAQEARGQGLAALGRQWFQNFELWGYGAAAYFDTGSDGWRPKGAFLVKDASLFVDAQSTDQISFFAQIWYARTGDTDDGIERVRELYAHFRDLLEDEGSVNVKIGAFDLHR